jgi:hypothetical protein
MGVDWWEAGCIDHSRRRLEGEGREPYGVLPLLLAAREAGAHPMLADRRERERRLRNRRAKSFRG